MGDKFVVIVIFCNLSSFSHGICVPSIFLHLERSGYFIVAVEYILSMGNVPFC